MANRNVKISWGELSKILQNSGVINKGEDIKAITLVKRKVILIQVEIV